MILWIVILVCVLKVLMVQFVYEAWEWRSGLQDPALQGGAHGSGFGCGVIGAGLTFGYLSKILPKSFWTFLGHIDGEPTAHGPLSSTLRKF